MKTFVDKFNYNLPENKIAQTPVEPRDSSKLMVLHKSSNSVENIIFSDITNLFNSSDVLVLNNSKVFKSRLQAHVVRTDTEMEVFLLRPLSDNRWEVMVGNGRRVKLHDVLDFGGLQGEVLQKNDKGTVRLKMNMSDDGVFSFAKRHGITPLPPYIKNNPNLADRYQTVYANPVGSSAAPTAGLHFTEKLLEQLSKKGVKIIYITLHVGLGTFQPIKTEFLEDHPIHSEYVEISPKSAQVISRAKMEKRRVIAVGTTVARALEGVAPLSQDGFSGNVNIFITPGYDFKIIDGLITNFHLPKTSLLAMVSAFAGKDKTFSAYDYAIKHEYRFYSFGDAMIIL